MSIRVLQQRLAFGAALLLVVISLALFKGKDDMSYYSLVPKQLLSSLEYKQPWPILLSGIPSDKFTTDKTFTLPDPMDKGFRQCLTYNVNTSPSNMALAVVTQCPGALFSVQRASA